MRISTAAETEVEVRAWQDYANCLGVDPDLFFPERGASTREAKEVCRGCVVREECLEYALANGEKFGIWGGMSERERRRIRRPLPITGMRIHFVGIGGSGMSGLARLCKQRGDQIGSPGSRRGQAPQFPGSAGAAHRQIQQAAG